MSDETRERLSALMDGELAEAHARRTLDETLSSDELRVTWERFHLIRDAVREPASPVSLVDRVRAGLESEPVVLAPRRPRLARRVVPLAVAASLLVAVGAFGLLGGSAEQGGGVEPIVERQKPAPVVVADGGREVRTLRWAGDVRPTVARRLNNYLVNHNERGGMPGMHPYARLVSYEQQRYQ